MMIPMMPKLIELARLCLQLGRVNRATYHEDGVTRESDTDHTTMLGIVAPAFAATYAPHLNLGLISIFSQVHDFVEVHAGDTNTLVASAAQELPAKKLREAHALAKLIGEFAESFPWLPAMIAAYEGQATPEARFVKILDKVLPPITHILNGGAALREHGVGLAQLVELHAAQRAKIAETIGEGQPEACALLAAVHAELHDRLAAAGPR